MLIIHSGMAMKSGKYTAAKAYLSEKFDDLSGKTESNLKTYVQQYFSNPRHVGGDYFERGLEVAVAFRSAKRFHNPEQWKNALSKFEELKTEFSGGGTMPLAVDLWANTEAYKATGDEGYVSRAKKDADALVLCEKKADEKPEDELMAASSLLRLYEALKDGLILPRAIKDSEAESYKKKAEGLLDGFVAKKTARKQQPAGLEKLAARAYMDAHRVTGKYELEAKEFFESSDKSSLLYSEADKAFGKEYTKAYRELMKNLPEPSCENVYAALNESPSDLPSYFGRAAAGAGRLILGAGLPVAKKAVYGIGGMADYIGEKLETQGDKLVEADYKKIGGAVGHLGRAIPHLFGTETLKHTSVEFGLAFAPGFGALGNFSVGLTEWLGDLNYYEQNGGRFSDYHRYLYWALNTPVASAGNSTFGFGTSVNAIPYTNFYVDPRMETMRFGMPNFLALWLGKVGTSDSGQYARGAFTGVDLSVGPIAVNGFLYYPPLGSLVNVMKKPAGWLRSKNDAILDGVKKIGKKNQRANLLKTI